jgi:uncharacterized protein YqhQ
MEEKIRLGGMALANGVLVHGPTSWACAVRLPNGELKVVAQRKRINASSINQPLLRGPVRLAEMLSLVPQVKRKVPEAKLPFERPGVIATMFAGAAVMRSARGSRLPALARELVVGLASLAPAVLALRGSGLAAYHGAEHISIGTYENGERAPKEHPRCGSQLIAPLVASSLAANIAVSRLPRAVRGLARLAGTTAAVGASVELFAWMTRNPQHPLARVLSRPGFELQRRFSTAEPSDAQVEVADAARDACLALEA